MSLCWYVQLSTVSNYVISFFFFSCLFGVLKSAVFCVLSVSELKRIVTISKLGWCWPPYRSLWQWGQDDIIWRGAGGGGNKHSQDNNVNNTVTSNLSNLRVQNKYWPPLIWKNGIYSALRMTSLNLLKTFGFCSFYFLLVCISLMFICSAQRQKIMNNSFSLLSTIDEVLLEVTSYSLSALFRVHYVVNLEFPKKLTCLQVSWRVCI